MKPSDLLLACYEPLLKASYYEFQIFKKNGFWLSKRV